MFITEQEAAERLRSSDNLLNRLRGPVVERPAPPKPDERVERPDAYEEAENNSTLSSEDDPVRLAVLAGRRETRPPRQRGGRYPGQQNVTPMLRSLIGAAAQISSTEKVAQTFGISHLAAHNYSQAKPHNKAEVDPDMIASIDRDTHAIRKQVLGVLAFTIAKITPESIENKEPKELSIIARNLSSVMAGTRPIEAPDQSRNAQVIVFSPEQQTKDDYGTVEIG
jgi:hypothetical protein